MTSKFSYLGKGIYSIPESSHLTGVSPQRIRRWVKGPDFHLNQNVQATTGLWKSDLPIIDNSVSLSFMDLIEVRFINAFLKCGVKWSVLRVAITNAKELVSSDHPFSTKKFKTDGRTIFAEIAERSGKKSLLDLAKNQYGIRTIIEPSLYKGLEYSRRDKLIRWWPYGNSKKIVIDPQRSFGQPIIENSGVPTSIIYTAYKAQDSVSKVAKCYDITTADANKAIKYEMRLAA